MVHRLAATAVAAGALAAPAAASAAADIEGVWSFSGGQIAVQAQPDGTFKGWVIRPTTFDPSCTHQIGELTWDGVRAQGDGSYWGGHQWFNSTTCTPINRGNTAFRVLADPTKGRFLRVCFSKPETLDVQPKIAPDGSSTDVNESCVDSDLIGPLQQATPKLGAIATLPRATRRCRRSPKLKLVLRQPNADALKTVAIYLNGKRVRQRSGAAAAGTTTLTHVPRGRRSTVRIVATTLLGKTITGKRTYRTCKR